jgi:chondroitin AC lyase
MRKRKRVLARLSVLVVPLVCLGAAPPPDRLKDIETVKKRIYEFCLGDTAPLVSQKKLKQAEDQIKSLQPDGTWKDVDYRNRRASAWTTMAHLYRVRELARVYRAPGHRLHGNANLKKAVHSALDFWLKKDFKNGNWWWNTIGVPRQIYRILILLEDELSAEQMKKGLEILKRGKIGMTGQNRVWVCDITMVRGCLQKDANLVAKAIGSIAGTVRISGGEGLQADYSFYQHGKCLYSGGYGKGFSLDASRVASLARGTSFAFSKEKIDLLSHYILDGQQWMVRGETWDYGAVGREITRKGHRARSLIATCRNMAALDTPRKKEFEAMAARIEKGADTDESDLTGNRHFWRSDIMTHHRRKWYASARMFSRGVDNTDSPCNGEGLLSHHIADGVTIIFRDGKEYFDIFGAWDWRKLPGTTIQQKASKGPRRSGQSTFAGGVSDGTYGMAAFKFVRDELRARKSWFFFDDEFVCLGAGISGSTDARVLTTLNQCHLRGPVAVSVEAGEKTPGKGRHKLENVRWVHHDRVGYLFPEPRAVTVRNEPQTNSWRRINRRYPANEGTLDVFSAWIDHGAKPKDSGYCYVVVPGIERKDMKRCAGSLAVKVIENTADRQAVHHPGPKVTGIAFYAPGRIAITDSLHVSVDKPCLVLVRSLPGKLQIAVSNPENRPLQVKVNVSAKPEGKGSALSFKLPDKLYAGQSVVRVLER